MTGLVRDLDEAKGVANRCGVGIDGSILLCHLLVAEVPLWNSSCSVSFVGGVELGSRWQRGIPGRGGARVSRSKGIRVGGSTDEGWGFGFGRNMLRVMSGDNVWSSDLLLLVLVIDLVEDVLVEIGIGGVSGPVSMRRRRDIEVDVDMCVGSIVVNDIGDRFDGYGNGCNDHLGSNGSGSGSSSRVGMSELVLGHGEGLDCEDEFSKRT
jgi:hypothetical protein